MDKAASRFETSDIYLYPDQILTTYKLDEPNGFVKVRGTVKNIYPSWDKEFLYGELLGVKHSIRFRCPVDKGPRVVNEKLVLGGVLVVEPSKIHNGLDVLLDGVVSGTWESKAYEDIEFIMPERQSPKKPFFHFIRDENAHLPDLLVIGTKTGLEDYRKQLNGINVRWNESIVPVIDSDRFMKGLDVAIEQYKPKAIAILRGGDTADKTIRIWDDARLIDHLLKSGCYLYSAIGHEAGYVLLDKYADQHFSTPTDFGHAIFNGLKQIGDENDRAEHYAEIDDSNESLKDELSSLKVDHADRIAELEKKSTRQQDAIKQVKEKQIEKLKSRSNKLAVAVSFLATALVGGVSFDIYRSIF